MGKGDPKTPRGKMSSQAFFVQTCREEHKKKHPDASVNFSEFSKKCSERWKTMSAKEKGKFEDVAKADKARSEREMKTYIPPKGETKKKFKDPNAPKRPPSCSVLNIAQKSKENILAYPLVMLQRNWERCGITLLQAEKSKKKKEKEEDEEEDKEEEKDEVDEDEEDDQLVLAQFFFPCLYSI
ncbi:High mobility group protein B1 [Tupaia chinensis]|uniref:High mobility group protein B1 n=1 Tax=Tupaia chinensis TaxID=246437 RepID=L9L657_TUPCH|nr:High mobility group protein B1 [Tupaia chinensis]